MTNVSNDFPHDDHNALESPGASDVAHILDAVTRISEQVTSLKRALHFATDSMAIALSEDFDPEQHREYWTDFIARVRETYEA